MIRQLSSLSFSVSLPQSQQLPDLCRREPPRDAGAVGPPDVGDLLHGLQVEDGGHLGEAGELVPDGPRRHARQEGDEGADLAVEEEAAQAAESRGGKKAQC